jgi:large subunit ribosomal protein L31e
MKKEENEEKEPEINEEKAKEESEETGETVKEPETGELAEEVTEELPKEEKAAEEVVGAEEKAPARAEEEEKPSKEEKVEEEEGEEIVEERIYTVPLSRAWIVPANKRAARAVRILKSFITKHMKVGARKEAEGEEEEEPGKLIVSNEVNLRIWSRGIQKPPRKIRVRAAKDKEGNVTVYLAEGD